MNNNIFFFDKNPVFDIKQEEKQSNEYYNIYNSTNKSSNFSPINKNFLNDNSNILKLEENCKILSESKNLNLQDSHHISNCSLNNETNYNKKAKKIIIPKLNLNLIPPTSTIKDISSCSQATFINNSFYNQNIFDDINMKENFFKTLYSNFSDKSFIKSKTNENNFYSKINCTNSLNNEFTNNANDYFNSGMNLNSYPDRTNYIDSTLTDTNSKYKFIRERNNFKEIANITDSFENKELNSTNKEKQSIRKSSLNSLSNKKDLEYKNDLYEKCRKSCEEASKFQKNLTQNFNINSYLGNTYKKKKLKDFNEKIDLNFVKNVPIENEDKQLFVYGKNSNNFNTKDYYIKPNEKRNRRQLENIDKINDISVYRVKNVLMKRFGMEVGNVKKEKLNFMKSDLKEKHKKIKFLLNSDFEKNIHLINKIDKIHQK